MKSRGFVLIKSFGPVPHIKDKVQRSKDELFRGKVVFFGGEARSSKAQALGLEVGSQVTFNPSAARELPALEGYWLLEQQDVLPVREISWAGDTEDWPLRSTAGRRKAGRFEELRQLLTKHAVSLLRDPQAGIRCLAIGRKSGRGLEAGAPMADLCITAYVDRKLPESQIPGGTSVASAFSARALGGGTETRSGLRLDEIVDVVESGSAFQTRPGFSVPSAQRGLYRGLLPSVDTRKPHRSLRCGLGVTNPHLAYPSTLSVGTLGFFVADESGDLHLVSNNHVIGDSNGAQVGEPVVQPGTLDVSDPELQKLATEADVVRFFGVAEVSAVVQLRFADPANVPINEVDAAMARIQVKAGGFPRETNDVCRLAFSGKILGMAPEYSIDDQGVLLGEARVYKVGRTTGYTEGRITGLLGTAAIDYHPRGASGARTAHFQNLLMIEPTSDNGGPFSDRGDSGSGILTANHELVGLLFAGSTLQTLACPARSVVEALGAAYGQPLKVVTT